MKGSVQRLSSLKVFLSHTMVYVTGFHQLNIVQNLLGWKKMVHKNVMLQQK